jgi:hypothetical protein
MTRAGVQAYIVAVICGACSFNPGSQPAFPTDGVPHFLGTEVRSSPDRSVLTSGELMETSCVSVYQAIQRLRPHWLRKRGPVRVTPSDQDFPAVVVDGMWHGNLGTLRSIPLEGVRHLRYLASGPATLRYGAGYPSGVIEIRMGGTR